jgi:hypothetical protein
MSFFSKLFSSRKPSRVPPDIEFGRFTDGYKSEEKYDAWDQAIDFFEDGDYPASFRSFFSYLSDDQGANVQYEEDQDKITFSILQGSKKITGYTNSKTFKAEGKIAHASELNIGFMRRLIEGNFNLKYGRYSLDENQNITIVFDSIILDASPYKLYYGLKEIALAADKQDDLLIEEFDMLEPINNSHIILLATAEKKIKLAYLRTKIDEVLSFIKEGTLNPVQYPGGITYLLLDAIYKLDFLVRPEGYTMETFERINRTFFAADGLNSQQKNHVLIKELAALQERPDERINEELYRTISTFGVLGSTNHERLKDLIEGELVNMLWYKENEFDTIALAVPGYIVGHALFNYSLPEPDKDFLMLYYQVLEPEYFRQLGFEMNYIVNGLLIKSEIAEAIQYIVQTWKNKYPHLRPDISTLDFTDLATFAATYLQMLATLDLTKTTTS